MAILTAARAIYHIGETEYSESNMFLPKMK